MNQDETRAGKGANSKQNTGKEFLSALTHDRMIANIELFDADISQSIAGKVEIRNCRIANVDFNAID